MSKPIKKVTPSILKKDKTNKAERQSSSPLPLQFRIHDKLISSYETLVTYSGENTMLSLFAFFDTKLQQLTGKFLIVNEFECNSMKYSRDSKKNPYEVFKFNTPLPIKFDIQYLNYPKLPDPKKVGNPDDSKNPVPGKPHSTGKSSSNYFTILFLDHGEKSIPINSPFDNDSLKEAICNQIYHKKIESLMLYSPDGQLLDSSHSYEDYLKIEPDRFLVYAVPNPSGLADPNIHIDSIVENIDYIAQFNTIASSKREYSTLLSCILYFIQNHFCGANHIVESILATCSFTPFARAVFDLYHNIGEPINFPLLFILTHYLSYQCKDPVSLYQLFYQYSIYQCKELKDDELESFPLVRNVSNLPLRYDSNIPSLMMPGQSTLLSLIQMPIMFKYYVGKNTTDVGYCISTGKNKIARFDEGPQIIQYYDPVDQDCYEIPHSKVVDFESRNNISDNTHYDQITIAFIDYSSTMLVALDEKGTRIAQIAVNIINKMAQATRDVGIIDPFYVFGKDSKKCSCLPLEYKKDDFTNTISSFWDRLNAVLNYISDNIRQTASIRVVAVSYGNMSTDYKTSAEICKRMIENNIKLDLVLLNNNASVRMMCAVSHLTHGLYLHSSTEEEAYKIAELETMVNISMRKQIPNMNQNVSTINKDLLRRISKYNYWQSVDEIHANEYNPGTLILDSTIIQPGPLGYLESRVCHEKNICFRIAQYYLSRYPDRTPRILSYHLLDKSNKIIPNKILAFVLNDTSDKDFIFPVLVTFPYYYPYQCPSFRILFDIPLKDATSNGFLKWDWNYHLESHVYDMLYFKQKETDTFVNSQRTDLPKYAQLSDFAQIQRYYYISCDKLPNESDTNKGKELYEELHNKLKGRTKIIKI